MILEDLEKQALDMMMMMNRERSSTTTTTSTTTTEAPTTMTPTVSVRSRNQVTTEIPLSEAVAKFRRLVAQIRDITKKELSTL